MTDLPVTGEDAGDDFGWCPDDEDIIVRAQDAIAIYPNQFGAVVLRRERGWYEESDTTVIIAPEHAVRVAHAILAAAGLGEVEFVRPTGGGGYEDVPISAPVARLEATTDQRTDKPKDPTASERQRRYRDRKRNGVTPEGTVTHNGRDGRNGAVTRNSIDAPSAVTGLFPAESSR